MGARGRGTMWGGARRGAARGRHLLALALAVVMLSLVAQSALDGAHGVGVARAQARVGLMGQAPLSSPGATETPTESPTVTETPTETPTPTPTPTPVPPTLALVSPSSDIGPVGAHVTLQGTRWGTGKVRVGIATSPADCPTTRAWLATLGTPTAAGGAFTLTALWPLSVGESGVTYTICALGVSGSALVASVAYQVLGTTLPTLSLSAASIQTGLPVTIHGANFYGVAGVTLTLRTANGARVLARLAPFGDGTFSYPYIASAGDVGTATISADSAAEGGAPPALQASAVLSVVGLGTPTATAMPTATMVVGPPDVVTPSTPPSNAPALWLPILLGMVALLLAALGVSLVLLLRRPQGAPGAGLPWASGIPTGGPRVAPGTGPLSAAAGGGAWQEMDDWVPDDWMPGEEGPGPDWHPRPMGGTRARMPAVEAGAASAGARERWGDAPGYRGTPPLAETAPGLPADAWRGEHASETRAGDDATGGAIGATRASSPRDAAATNPDGTLLEEGGGAAGAGATRPGDAEHQTEHQTKHQAEDMGAADGGGSTEE